MTAGRLAADKPGATTNTVLYRCNTERSASTVLNVCNQSGSAATYRTALRDYDQVLHLDGLNSSAYKFQRGNPLSAYKLTLNPGFTMSNAIPGTTFTTTNGATAKLLDVFKPTDIAVYYTKVLPVSSTPLQADSQAGTFDGGETLTGSTSGFTANFRGSVGPTMYIEYADVASGATSVKISRNTGLADGMYITIGGVTAAEIVTINASGIDTLTNTLTITRGALGTSAAAIVAGSQVNAWSESATTSTIDEGATYAAGDQTLTVADSTGFIGGGVIKVDNEIMTIEAVNGNDLTVSRGRYGTADVDHNNGVAVTLLTDNGVYLLNFWTEAETITGSSSNATAILGFPGNAAAQIDNKYCVSQTSAVATDHVLADAPTFNIDRTYKYDLSDATCSNYPLKFSADDAEGTNGSGTEYTAGVSKVGTAGTAGAYTSVEITDTTSNLLFSYADGSPAGSTTGVGFQASVQSDPTYTEIYVYDVGGEALAAADTFTVNQITQTIEANGVEVGPYGYVQEWYPMSCHLKVTLGIGSEAFTANDSFYDTPTLNNGTRVITTVRDGKMLTFNNVGVADGSRTQGTYTSISPNSSGGSGDLATTKVTVVVDGSGAATITLLNGGYGHAGSDTLTINDSQLGGGGGAALTFDVATISTGIHTDQTGIYDAEDYFFYGKAIDANVTDKNSSIIVGPGQNLLVYSSAADLSYVVNGFETNSDDFPVVQLTKVATGGGGGGAAP